MKIKRLHLTPILTVLIATFIVGCNPLEKLQENYSKNVKVKTEPEVMEVHADTVSIDIKGKISGGYLKKESIIRYDPVLSYGGMDTTLPPFYVKEKKVEVDSNDERNYIATINRKSGGSFSHNIKLPYKPAMKESKIKASIGFKIDSKYDSLDKCVDEEEPNQITEGTITTSLTVKPREDVMMGGVSKGRRDKELKPGESPRDLEGSGSKVFSPKHNRRSPVYGVVRPEFKSVEGTILFDINKSYIRQSVKKGEAMKRIRNFAKTKHLVLNDIDISSFASPDGELELNANLTKERANSTHDYLKKELEKLGHSSVHDSDFTKEATTKEDWNGFKRLVQESSLDNKNEILSIANSNMELDEKENAIRELDVWESYLVDTLLPKLRRSEIKVKGYLRLRSDDSIQQIADKHGLDSLHRKELIKLAHRSNSIERKREIYEHYTKRYPENWVGHNNLNALLLFEGRYEEAKKAFDKLSERYPNVPHIKSNLGIANRHMRKYDTARQNYEFAKGKGLDERNNLAILDIKIADYASSVETFEENRCDYNVALAYTLKEDYENALKVIDCITEKSADVFYLRAIIGARQGDKELMTTSLTRAVEKDGSIRERAKNDLEFRKFRGTEAFKNALR